MITQAVSWFPDGLFAILVITILMAGQRLLAQLKPSGGCDCVCVYTPLVMTNIAIENGNWSLIYPFKRMILRSLVSLPEGVYVCIDIYIYNVGASENGIYPSNV